MKTRIRFLSRLFLLFACILAALPALASGIAMHVIDVGQGDSIFIQFPNGSTMLVDAGPADAGPTVVRYLKNLGVRKIDILVLTHPHSDHLGGMSDVLAAFGIGKIWDSGYRHGSGLQRRFLEAVAGKKIRFGRPKAGFSELVGAAVIDVLAPIREISGTKGDVNNNCLVLRVSYGYFTALLMADAEREERASVGAFPQSAILKVSHHGSHNGTDAAFLRQVRPEVAVISCAAENDYGHPHEAVLRMLGEAWVPWRSTAKDGSVVISSDGRRLFLKTGAQTSAAVGAAAAGGGGYIGNVRSRVFHLPTCTGLPDEKKRVRFDDREDAIREGYTPCGRCNP
jgi:competence protein ComEC